MDEINTTAIIGMGALGVTYGAHILDHAGPGAVRFILDSQRMRKYSGVPNLVNEKSYMLPLVEAENATPVDLLIVAVKFTGLQSALDLMRTSIGPDTVILSVINGVTSEEIISERYGSGHMVYAIAQGMDAVKFGQKLTFTKTGQIRMGARNPDQQKNVDKIARYFDKISLEYVVEQDIMRRLWSKFMLNVGINQACTVCETNYGGCTKPGMPNILFISAMREAMALANAEGYDLNEKDLSDYIRLMESLSPEGIPSMRQDALARRRTEVELFAGTVVRLARKHNILVPVNQYFLEWITKMEKSFTAPGQIIP